MTSTTYKNILQEQVKNLRIVRLKTSIQTTEGQKIQEGTFFKDIKLTHAETNDKHSEYDLSMTEYDTNQKVDICCRDIELSTLFESNSAINVLDLKMRLVEKRYEISRHVCWLLSVLASVIVGIFLAIGLILGTITADTVIFSTIHKILFHQTWLTYIFCCFVPVVTIYSVAYFVLKTNKDKKMIDLQNRMKILMIVANQPVEVDSDIIRDFGSMIALSITNSSSINNENDTLKTESTKKGTQLKEENDYVVLDWVEEQLNETQDDDSH